MQKFLAIFVVLAFVATGAFALDLSAGGKAVFGFGSDTADVKEGDPDKEVSVSYGAAFDLTAGAVNDSNTAGAKGRIGGGSIGANATVVWAYAWWQPIDQVFLKLGKLGEDGKYWVGDDIVGWGLNANDYDQFFLGSDNYAGWTGGQTAPAWTGPAGKDSVSNRWNPFPGAFLSTGIGYVPMNDNEKTGIQLSVLPIDGMHVTFGWSATKTLKDTFVNGLSVQAAYAIPGAGTAAVTFANADADDDNGIRHIGLVYHHPLDNMNIQLGIELPLPVSSDIDMPGINIGLGFGMGNRWSGQTPMGDQFQLTARFGAFIGTAEGMPTVIGLDVCPNYDIGIFRVFVPLGFSIGLPSEGDSEFRWSFYPYIVKDLGGVCTLWAGITLWNGVSNPNSKKEATDKEADAIGWKIPVGIQFSF